MKIDELDELAIECVAGHEAFVINDDIYERKTNSMGTDLYWECLACEGWYNHHEITLFWLQKLLLRLKYKRGVLF